MKSLFFIAAVATFVAAASPVYAQHVKPEDAVKYRRGTFSVIGTHFGRLGAMAYGNIPFDAKAAGENADLLAKLARLPWASFSPDTGKVGNTKAKPEIWTEPAKYKQCADAMVDDLDKLAIAAKTNKFEFFQNAFWAANGSCKACHNAFRN